MGVIAAPAHRHVIELAHAHGHLGRFDHHRDAIDDRGPFGVDANFSVVLLTAKHHHRQATGRDDHIGPSRQQVVHLFLEFGGQLRIAFFGGKGVHEIAHFAVDRTHTHAALGQAIANHLVFVPGGEYRVDGDEPKFPSQGAGMQHGGFAQANDRDVHQGLHLGQARILEVRDGDHAVPLLLCNDRVFHEVARHAKFGHRVGGGGRRGGGVEAVGECGVDDAFHMRFELGDVGRMGNPVGGALDPNFVGGAHGAFFVCANEGGGVQTAAGRSNIFPGLSKWLGSSACLMVCINAISEGSREQSKKGFLIKPTPCSADTLPCTFSTKG